MTDSEEREEFAVEVPEIPNETDADDSDGDTNNRRKGDTKVGLTLRIVVALYVLYLAYDLIRGFGETAAGDRIFIAAGCNRHFSDCRRRYSGYIREETD